MNKKSIEKYIRAVKPGHNENRHHQRNLRRELLNSNKFSLHPVKRIMKSYEFVTALSVFTVAMIIIYFNVHVNKLSSSDLLSRVNTTYAGFMLPGKINSFNSELNLFTKEDPQTFSINTLQDYNDKKLFTEVNDTYTNDTLYKLLILKGAKYVSANPGIKFFNVHNSGKKIISTHLSSVSDYTTDSMNVKIDGSKSKVSIHLADDAFMTISRSNVINPEINNMFKKDEIIQVHAETDFDSYISSTPLTLLDDLNTSDSISVFHDESSDTLLIKLESDMSQVEFKSLVVTLSSDSSKDTKTFLQNLTSGNDSTMLTWLSSTEPMPDSLKVYLPQRIIIVKIDASDYSINGAEFSVNKNGQSLKLAEVDFTNHSYTTPNAKVFDPAGKDLLRTNPHSANYIE